MHNYHWTSLASNTIDFEPNVLTATQRPSSVLTQNRGAGSLKCTNRVGKVLETKWNIYRINERMKIKDISDRNSVPACSNGRKWT